MTPLNGYLLASGAAVALSGAVLQVHYHLLKNTDPATTWGLYRAEWNTLHVWSSVLWVAAIAMHLWRHRKWVRGVVKKRLFKKNRPTVILIAVTFLTIVSGFTPLFTSVLWVVEIHDKVAILFLILAVAHTIRRKVL